MPPIAVSSSRSWSPGWVVLRGQPGTVTSPPVTSAAAKNGAAPDRSGSMFQARPASRPGSTAHTFGRGVVDAGAGGPQHLRRSSAGAARWAPAGRRGARRCPGRSRPRPAAARRRAGWRRRVDGRPRRRVPGRCRGRSAAGRRWRAPRCRTPSVAQRVEQRGQRAVAGVRVAVEGDRPVGQRRPPAAGSASPCRPGRRRRGPGRAAGGAGPPSRSSSTVDTCVPMRAQAGGHQLGVPGAQRLAQRARADRDRARAPGPARSSTWSRAGARSRATGSGGGRRGPGRAVAVRLARCSPRSPRRGDGRGAGSRGGAPVGRR